jgi:hypothetical protein
MAMSVVVGVIPALYADNPPELEELRREFATINKWLRAAGLPSHREPRKPRGDAPWSCRVGSWVCLSYLRRLAAHVALNGTLPRIGEVPAAEDPTFARYRAVSRRSLILREEPPADTRGQLLLPADFPPHAVQTVAGPDFSHLIWHCGATGYYLPIRFTHVLEPPPRPGDEWPTQIGSSYTLLEECERLAAAMDFPLELSIEELRAEEPDLKATDWTRFRVEAFMCKVLMTACEVSIRSGCAVVFC